MSHWKTACKWIAIISLLFLAIPIRVKRPIDGTIALFDNYIKQFNKTYVPDSEEYKNRLKVFQISLSIIEEMNSARQNNHTARYGLTQFSDLTQDEFMSRHLDKVKRFSKRHQKRKKARLYHQDDVPKHNVTFETVFSEHRFRRQIVEQGLPSKVDWRERGYISKVANQGLCGACWAYSTVQVAEAMAAIKYGNLTELSVQEMIDCAKNGNLGCRGGDICSLLSWLTQNNINIVTQKNYPTTGSSSDCHLKTNSTDGVRIKSYTCDSFIGKEKGIIETVAINGPVAVAVNALSWQNYLGGVIQHHCDNDFLSLNHAVQIVGYDLTADIPHYIAKNSWGNTFGLDGYLHLAIDENTCGLANEVSSLQLS